MIRSKFILCAEQVIVDDFTNSISAIGIFTDITPQGFPLLIPKMSILHVTSKDEGDPDEYQTRVVLTVNDDVLLDQESPIEFRGRSNNRHRFNLSTFPIPQPGELRVSITVGEDLITASYVMRVFPPPQAQLEIEQDVNA